MAMLDVKDPPKSFKVLAFLDEPRSYLGYIADFATYVVFFMFSVKPIGL